MKPEQHIDEHTDERMKQREEFLRQETNRLLEEIERSRAAEEAPLLAMSQYQTFAGALVLLLLAYWMANKGKRDSESCSEHHSSSSEEDDDHVQEGNQEEKEDPRVAHNGLMALPVLTPLLNQGLPDTCKVLKYLVGDLLVVCRALSKRSFMLLLYPATKTDDACETWSIYENNIAYRLVVFLQPPPRHSFSLEPASTGKLPARHPSIRVVQECICYREQLLGDLSCFLHHTDGQQRWDWSSYILHTICTGSYLDVEKTTSWVQLLVASAWRYLPESHHWQLTVLPSSHYCTFQLTSTSEMNTCAEMKLAVQHSSSGTYLSLE